MVSALDVLHKHHKNLLYNDYILRSNENMLLDHVNIMHEHEDVLYEGLKNLTSVIQVVENTVFDYITYMTVLWGVFSFVLCTLLFLIEKQMKDMEVRIVELELRLSDNQYLPDYPDKV